MTKATAIRFAGIWRPWTGPRERDKSGDARAPAVLIPHLRAEQLVRPIHTKAMPVILTTDEETNSGSRPVNQALTLQRPPDELLRIVARGEREDALAA